MSDSRTLAILLGAAVVIGALFAPWYAVDLGAALSDAFGSQAGQPSAGSGAFRELARQFATLLADSFAVTAWTAFERTDVVLLGSAIAAAFAALLGRLEIAAVAGAIAAGNIVWSMVAQPQPSEIITLQWGAWLALGGAVLIVVGSKLSARPAPAPYQPPVDYSKPPVDHSTSSAPPGCTPVAADQRSSIPPWG